MAKLTTIGVYNYDEHLFDGLTFPAGIDKDIAVTQILDRSAEFEILYPNPTFFSQMITFWGKKHYRTFEKWVEGLAVPFDPLYNYDRFEEYVDERNAADTRSGSSSTIGNTSDKRSRDASSVDLDLENADNGSRATTQTSGNITGTEGTVTETDNTNETQVSAFDSASYSPKEKVIQDGAQTTSNVKTEGSATTSQTDGSSSTTTGRTARHQEDGSDSSNSSHAENREDHEHGTKLERVKHSAHLYGNIGVTTSAQMLREFLDIERWNIYEQIADLFVDEFCIMVY